MLTIGDLKVGDLVYDLDEDLCLVTDIKYNTDNGDEPVAIVLLLQETRCPLMHRGKSYHAGGVHISRMKLTGINLIDKLG